MMGYLGRNGKFARGLLLSLRILAGHRLRTALSVSGLLVGIAAVIVIVRQEAETPTLTFSAGW